MVGWLHACLYCTSNNITLLCRAVGCIFGELLNNSPLFPVSILEILVGRSDTKKKKKKKKKLFFCVEGLAWLLDLPIIDLLHIIVQYSKVESKVWEHLSRE